MKAYEILAIAAMVCVACYAFGRNRSSDILFVAFCCVIASCTTA